MHISFFFCSDNFDLPFFHPMSMNIELIVSAAWSLDLARRRQIYKTSCLSFGLLMNCCYTSWLLQVLPTYFYLNYAINFFVNVTNYCLELGPDNKNLSTIILPWVDSSVLESSTETSSMPQWKPLFFLFVSIFFLKMGMRKRSILSTEAID